MLHLISNYPISNYCTASILPETGSRNDLFFRYDFLISGQRFINFHASSHNGWLFQDFCMKNTDNFVSYQSFCSAGFLNILRSLVIMKQSSSFESVCIHSVSGVPFGNISKICLTSIPLGPSSSVRTRANFLGRFSSRTQIMQPVFLRNQLQVLYSER